MKINDLQSSGFVTAIFKIFCYRNKIRDFNQKGNNSINLICFFHIHSRTIINIIKNYTNIHTFGEIFLMTE